MRTDSIRPIAIILLLLCATLLAGQFTALALATPPEPARQPHILVRIHTLSATGPDGKTVQLFADKDGYVTTLDALGRIGSQVNAAELADGGYHTLYVQLGDEYELIGPDGERRLSRFSDKDKPTRIRIRGMIMVEEGKATPMHMLESPSYYGYPEGFREGEWDDD